MKLPKHPTVSAYLEYWLTSIVRPSTRPTTFRAYSEMVHGTLAPSLGDVVLRRLTTARIAAASDRWRLQGASNRKVRTALQVLRTALRAAAHRGWLAADPTAALPLPRYAPRTPRWLSPVQAARLLAAVRGHRYEPAFVLAIHAGLRRGEAGALQWKDLDLRRAVVTVRTTLRSGRGGHAIDGVKTAASQRSVPLPRAAVLALRRALTRSVKERGTRKAIWAPTDHVLSPGDGRPQWLSVLNHHLTATLRAVGLPHVSFHDLRHTAACLLLEAGAEPRTVMEILGHRRVAHTLVLYAHVRDDQKRQAVDAASRLLTRRATKRKRR
ncbi:MAG: site-specific integrase [Myxococcales bacterium]|nr:site-specific integrase [Myxococcales bacterium]